MLKLHTHPFSIVPWRVRIALHEKDLAYEVVEVDLYSSSAPAEFLELNPFAQIPVLEDGDFVLSESAAILEYLEDSYPGPRLMPPDPCDRATVRMLMAWGTDYWPGPWKKWMAPRMPAALAEPWTDASVAAGREALCHHLDVLEGRLQGARWLVGDYSLADIAYAPFVLVLDRVELGEEVARRPDLLRWTRQLLERKAVTDTMMPPSTT